VAVLMLLTLHCWATPPATTVTDALILGVLVAGKDCFGAAASLSSMVFAPGADINQREGRIHIRRYIPIVLTDRYTGI